ncbi:hypothetical protein AYR66_14535 [Noviherbaspirillum denitrificans]|uniref:Uncharacterized protein n=1 Tax=Noviherbaspirillum denitrificans TaxID=1968433 RepID=A0A254TIY0_9BURK|nr:hypothetical protein AYR66_14535 [Noviherbaspirillum denitrificans]
MMPVADQQERRQAGQFPENHQLHQVAGEDHAQHRPHEGEEKGEEARHRVIRRHVVTRIQRHQQADEQHKHDEQPHQAVHAQREVQAQRGKPFDVVAHHRAVADLRIAIACHQQAGHGNQSGQDCLSVACIGGQEGREYAPCERKQDECQQQCSHQRIPVCMTGNPAECGTSRKRMVRAESSWGFMVLPGMIHWTGKCRRGAFAQ